MINLSTRLIPYALCTCIIFSVVRNLARLYNIGFHLSRTKLEHMDCKFSKGRNKYEGALRLEGLELPKSESFQYVGSIIQKYGEFEDDVNHMIRVG